MNASLHHPDSNPQEKDLIANTLKRVEEINILANKDTLPQGFEVDEEGVWHMQEKKGTPPSREWISSPLFVTGYTRDHKNENHGHILEWSDVDGHKHVWLMPMELLAGESSKILGVLLNRGFRIAPKRSARERLLEYIAQCKPIHKVRCVSQCGWHKGYFVLLSQTIGCRQGEKIIYQNFSVGESLDDTSGSLDEWERDVANMATGNSRLILVLAAAFAGPLLEPMNHENIGLHLKGSSSLGKSTALYVGNSIWGRPASIRTYRATANGLEGIAAQHNDRILCLDELSQAQAQEAGQVIYMLGNGIGKGRACQQGLAKKQATWRIITLSTGEIGLSQLFAETGKKVKAGQEVRLIEIPADTGIYGLFENLHGFKGGADFSTHLKDACTQYYGIASRVFLEKLVADTPGALDQAQTVIDGLKQRYLPKEASPQVTRVFNHLALIAAAGELATSYKITGWEIGTTADGVMKCFQDWLQTWGGFGMQEERVALDQVKNTFQLHGESRFSPWERSVDDKTRTSNRLGYRKETDESTEYFVFIQAFRDEICKGLDYLFVEKVCLKHGLLVPDDKGHPTRPERFPGCKKTERCYRFRMEPLSEEKE